MPGECRAGCVRAGARAVGRCAVLYSSKTPLYSAFALQEAAHQGAGDNREDEKEALEEFLQLRIDAREEEHIEEQGENAGTHQATYGASASTEEADASQYNRGNRGQRQGCTRCRIARGSDRGKIESGGAGEESTHRIGPDFGKVHRHPVRPCGTLIVADGIERDEKARAPQYLPEQDEQDENNQARWHDADVTR